MTTQTTQTSVKSHRLSAYAAAAAISAAALFGSSSAFAQGPDQSAAPQLPATEAVKGKKFDHPRKSTSKPKPLKTSATGVAGRMAQVNFGEVRIYAACSYYRNTMDVTPTLRFNGRYPNGAYVSYRTAYRKVNSAGQALTGWYYTNYVSTRWVTPATHWERNGYNGGSVLVRDFNNLGSQRLPVNWSKWQAATEIIAHNGYAWETLGFAAPNGYANYDRFGSEYVANTCWVSQS